MSVTWVVPCFDEAARLRLDLFRSLLEGGHRHLLFVDDGSRDGTRAMLEAFANENPASVSVLSLDRNRGKGEAVRLGLLAALENGATLVGYADADLATPAEELLHLERELVLRGVDAAVGSRVRLRGTEVERRWWRHYLGRVFATAASIVLRTAIYDTQCGAKLFRRSEVLLDALREPFLSRWVFDVELIGRLLVSTNERYRLVEIPLRKWADVRGSKIGPGDFGRAARDLALIERDLVRRRAASGQRT